MAHVYIGLSVYIVGAPDVCWFVGVGLSVLSPDPAGLVAAELSHVLAGENLCRLNLPEDSHSVRKLAKYY